MKNRYTIREHLRSLQFWMRTIEEEGHKEHPLCVASFAAKARKELDALMLVLLDEAATVEETTEVTS